MKNRKINRRRLTAYRFLQNRKNPTIITLDLSQLPDCNLEDLSSMIRNKLFLK